MTMLNLFFLRSPALADSPLQRPPLPPVGIVWFPSVMGTGILANLLATHEDKIPGAHYASLLLLGLCWLILIVLVVGTLYRSARYPLELYQSLTRPAQIPFWGTVAMGFLSAGSALSAVVPTHYPQLASFAWQANTIVWCIGTTVGIISALGFGVRLVGGNLGSPSAVWGLAVVGPMVSATTGAVLSLHVPSQWHPYMLLLSICCFFLALFLGCIIFAYCYHRHWRIEAVPLVASASTWIPLGLVGQSTAAVQAIRAGLQPFVRSELDDAVAVLANGYGMLMLSVGVPLILWAAYVTVRGFYHRMPFTPGWWALTFPIGTVALGSTLLGRATEAAVVYSCGVIATYVLCVTVTLCLGASAWALLKKAKD